MFKIPVFQNKRHKKKYFEFIRFLWSNKSKIMNTIMSEFMYLFIFFFLQSEYAEHDDGVKTEKKTKPDILSPFTM